MKADSNRIAKLDMKLEEFHPVCHCLCFRKMSNLTCYELKRSTNLNIAIEIFSGKSFVDPDFIANQLSWVSPISCFIVS